jgi:hypothetical protein
MAHARTYTSSQITQRASHQIELPTHKPHQIANAPPSTPPNRTRAQIYRRRSRLTNRRGAIKPDAILRGKNSAAAGTDPDREEPELTRADLDRGAEGEGERGGRGDGSGEAKVSTFCSERLGTTPWVFFFFLAPGVPRFCGAVRGRV